MHTVRHGRPGAPPVLLACGMGGACFDWSLVTRLLAGPAAVTVAFDRPGTGHSAPTSTPPGLRREIDVLDAVLDAAVGSSVDSSVGSSVDSAPAVLVGHSVAALHVEAYARVHPHRVRGLVLVDPSTEPPGAERPRDRFAPVARLLLRTPSPPPALARWLGPACRRVMVRLGSWTGRETATRDEVAEVYSRPDVLRALVAENAAYDELVTEVERLRDEHPLPEVPLVVLTAREALGGPRQARMILGAHDALARMSPRGERVLVPGSGHLMAADRPDAVALAVRRVLDGT
ncbi:alpha/beta fold hydrolase [Streptoalloteichus tenebrarius]|uniref:alpha/beta fold hydrolase n=1 Tax=Streptoalloteichus tenebrarius (strain ATCC 17920 / DSM 40477 / JCM 4838 / CBS 697.72 / NBRC 16177 / NCIMB 11028 / NRRL B-12390 / A12253. 1 / ISP 5477) TaxID=1933 RepID=UPI0020A473EF|nr:alpha/beta hydrolase [Streptoalloteichus tenebrarius]